MRLAEKQHGWGVLDVMRRLSLLLLGTVFLTSPLHAEMNFIYTIYRDTTGEMLGQLCRTYPQSPTSSAQCKMRWTNARDNSRGTIDYVMDRTLGVCHMHFKEFNHNSEFTCERKGDQLFFKGIIQGQPNEKTFKIDDQPFYYEPSLGLQYFACSDERELDFWVINPMDLSVYKMHAVKECESPIETMGQKTAAVKIRWSLSGFFSFVYSQTFWFRKTDGLYVMSEKAYGEYHRLSAELPSASLIALPPQLGKKTTAKDPRAE